jgi:hypothetical protein
LSEKAKPVWKITTPTRVNARVEFYKWVSQRTVLVLASWNKPGKVGRDVYRTQINGRVYRIFLHDVRSGVDTSLDPVLDIKALQYPILDSFALSPDGKKILWYDAEKGQGHCALVSGKALCRWPYGQKISFCWMPDSMRFRVIRWLYRYAAEAVTYDIEGKVMQRVLLRSLPTKGKAQFQYFTFPEHYSSPFFISPELIVADTMTGHFTWDSFSIPDMEKTAGLYSGLEK